MVFLALTVQWAAQLVAGLLFFLVFLILAAAFVRFFSASYGALGWSLQAATEPVVAPVRRLLAPLRTRWGLRWDLAPWLTAVAFYVAQRVLLFGADMLAALLVAGTPVTFNQALLPYVRFFRLLLYVYFFMVLLRVLVSWFGGPGDHPFVRFLARWVDPLLGRVRAIVRLRRGRWDLAPLVLIAGLLFLDRVILEGLLYV